MDASPWANGWELDVKGVGTTQSETIQVAKKAARDYLAAELGGDPDDYEIALRLVINEDVIENFDH